MRFILRWVRWAIFLTVSAVLAVGLFYDKLVKYRQVGQREARQIENAELLSDLDLWAAAHPDATVEQVLGFALKASTEDIGYTFGKCATDPDGVFRNRRTNCVGYSALFDAAARRLLEKEGLASRVSTVHAIGKLRFLGFDLHRIKKLAAALLAALLATPAFSQIETKLHDTELTGEWRLYALTERCTNNDSVSHPAPPPMSVSFYKNGQMYCTDPRAPFFGGMTRWKLLDYGTTLSMAKSESEGTSFAPDINKDGDILFELGSWSDSCGMVNSTYVWRRAEKIEKEKAAQPAFVPNPDDPVFSESEVDTVPVFGRGQSSALRYNAVNIQYPEAARDNYIQGRVMVEFIVEKDGSLSNLKILHDIGGGCGDEAIRMVKTMPRWRVGWKGGERARVRVQYPVEFKLE